MGKTDKLIRVTQEMNDTARNIIYLSEDFICGLITPNEYKDRLLDETGVIFVGATIFGRIKKEEEA